MHGSLVAPEEITVPSKGRLLPPATRPRALLPPSPPAAPPPVTWRCTFPACSGAETGEAGWAERKQSMPTAGNGKNHSGREELAEPGGSRLQSSGRAVPSKAWLGGTGATAFIPCRTWESFAGNVLSAGVWASFADAPSNRWKWTVLTLYPQDSQPTVGTRAAASTSNKLTFREHIPCAQQDAGPVSFPRLAHTGGRQPLCFLSFLQMGRLRHDQFNELAPNHAWKRLQEAHT